MSLKSFQELIDHVLLGSLTLDDVGMFGGIKRVLQVIDIQLSTPILVSGGKCFLNSSKSLGAQATSDSVQEFVILDCAVIV